MNLKNKLHFPLSMKDKPATLGLGVFDGFHRGHQVIAEKVDALLTLFPHPDIVLKKNSRLLYLSTVNELRYFFPNTICLDFDSDVSQLSADAFLNDIILKELSPNTIVCGHDYSFGNKKKGSIELLSQWGRQHHIDIIQIPDITLDTLSIRSSRIRQTLEQGFFDQAITMLGHPYLIQGPVIKGKGKGKHIGFPTANIRISPHKCLPRNGVYKGTAILNNHSYQSIIYIGTNPTFQRHQPSVEVHLLDFSDSIYDHTLSVLLESHVRHEITFASKQALILQIKKDIYSSYGH